MARVHIRSETAEDHAFRRHCHDDGTRSARLTWTPKVLWRENNTCRQHACSCAGAHDLQLHQGRNGHLALKDTLPQTPRPTRLLKASFVLTLFLFHSLPNFLPILSPSLLSSSFFTRHLFSFSLSLFSALSLSYHPHALLLTSSAVTSTRQRGMSTCHHLG